MLWSIDSCQNRISADQYHLTVPRAQVSTHRGRVLFWSYPLTNYQFQMIAGSSLFFPMIHMKYVVFMSLWPRTVKILISNWPRTRKFSQLFKNTGGEDLFLPWSRVGHGVRPIFVLWLVKIWQVSACGKFMQHLESCLLWQLKLGGWGIFSLLDFFFSLTASAGIFFSGEPLCTIFFQTNIVFFLNSEILIHYLCFCAL